MQLQRLLICSTLFFACFPAHAQTSIVSPVPMVRIDAGAYPIGRDKGPKSARPRHLVKLRAFVIGKYEITNAQYAAFLNSLDIRIIRNWRRRGELQPNKINGPDAPRVYRNRTGNKPAFIELDDDDAQIVTRNGKFAAVRGSEQRPAPEVTWIGARAYCAWRGMRLPTEAEWEAAARGRTDRRYPWGNQGPNRQRAAFARTTGNTAAVNTMESGATPNGIFHLAGNVAEWTSSLFRPYPYIAGDGRENRLTSGERVTRGGDHTFDVERQKLSVSFRDGFSRNPAAGHRHIGFRCARNAN